MDGSHPLTGFRSSWSSSLVKSPTFFKIIDSSSCLHQKLALPKNFVSTYGKNLGTHVYLKVPTGAVWEVELIKSTDVACLCKGWEEFAKYYSIGLCHLLVFRYEGNSTFHVIIFDASASEIEYPYFNKCDAGILSAPEDLKPRVQLSASSKNKSDSLKKSKGFKSKYPHCMIFMQPSYVSTKQTVNIPVGFGRKYLGKQSREVLLKMSVSSRTWSAKFHFSVGKYRLRWMSFVRDNKIKTGDVCAFELIESSEPVLNVTVFRASAKE